MIFAKTGGIIGKTIERGKDIIVRNAGVRLLFPE